VPRRRRASWRFRESPRLPDDPQHRATFAFLALLALACTSAPQASEPRAEEPAPVAPERAWTRTFLEEAVLMARVVRIEGPPGLRDHLALVQDGVRHVHEVTTTREGLLQRTTVRDDLDYPAPIRCQLDRVTIVAERQLLVLERPGDVSVTVVAEGDAFFKRAGEETEQRGAVLRIVGQPR